MEVSISQDFLINTYFPITTYPIKFFDNRNRPKYWQNPASPCAVRNKNNSITQ